MNILKVNFLSEMEKEQKELNNTYDKLEQTLMTFNNYINIDDHQELKKKVTLIYDNI